MKKDKEKIEVMQAFLAGKKILCKDKNDCNSTWIPTGFPLWDWIGFDYMVAEEKPVLEKLIDYPEDIGSIIEIKRALNILIDKYNEDNK